MLRNIVGSVLALVGAAATVWSPFRAWYDGRRGRDYRLGDLFSGGGVTGARAELFGSAFLPFVVLALLALLGILLRSRPLVALTGLLVLAVTVLWMVRVAQAEGELVLTANGNGLGDGVAGALGGGLLLVIGALVMRGRRHRGHREPAPAPAEGHDPQAWAATEQDRTPTQTLGTLGQPQPQPPVHWGADADRTQPLPQPPERPPVWDDTSAPQAAPPDDGRPR
ncbi:hypothetical protein ACIRF8_01170 [Streptomyces sp. NPDC102406]|uniref:hypothetical protein n=1 Tax=Streptomyces sp. NPDC102406 TaxID=3366171 RepID=UPI003821B389